MIWARTHAAAEYEEGQTGEAEEDEIDGDHVVENFFVLSGHGDDRGENSLQTDGDHRDSGAVGKVGDLFEEKTVFGHSEKDAGRGEHSLTQETESGNGDGKGHEDGTFIADGPLEDSVGGCGGVTESDGAEDAETDDVDTEIDGGDSDDAEEEGAGEVAFGVAHLAGHKAGGLPAAICE